MIWTVNENGEIILGQCTNICTSTSIEEVRIWISTNSVTLKMKEGYFQLITATNAALAQRSAARCKEGISLHLLLLLPPTTVIATLYSSVLARVSVASRKRCSTVQWTVQRFEFGPTKFDRRRGNVSPVSLCQLPAGRSCRGVLSRFLSFLLDRNCFKVIPCFFQI